MFTTFVIGWIVGVASLASFLGWLSADDGDHWSEEASPVEMTKEEWARKAMH